MKNIDLAINPFATLLAKHGYASFDAGKNVRNADGSFTIVPTRVTINADAMWKLAVDALALLLASAATFVFATVVLAPIAIDAIAQLHSIQAAVTGQLHAIGAYLSTFTWAGAWADLVAASQDAVRGFGEWLQSI